MKKTIALLTLAILFMAAVSGFVTRVYPYEIKAGKPEDLVVLVFNHENAVSKESQVRISVPELDVRDKSENFRLKPKYPGRVHFEVEVSEDVKPDYYPVIITFTNKDGKREKTHSWVYVE